MRFISAALCATVAAALLAGCSGGGLGSTSPSAPSAGGAQSHFTNGHIIPQWSKFASLIPVELRPTGTMPLLHGKMAPAASVKGIYASEFYGTSIVETFRRLRLG